MNQSKTTIKHISYDSKCKFDGRKCNLNGKWNKKLCQSEFKNPIKHYEYENCYAWNPSTCACEINKYFESTADDLLITCDEILDKATKSYGNPINLHQ